jgi:hypothetical protein
MTVDINFFYGKMKSLIGNLFLKQNLTMKKVHTLSVCFQIQQTLLPATLPVV